MKILVVRLGRIGDMVLSTPLLFQLKNRLENVEIDVLASRDNHSILQYADYVNNVYIFDKNPLKLIPLLVKLRRAKYDIFFDPKDHFSTETHYLAKLIGATKRIGFKRDEHSAFDINVSSFNQDKVHFQDKILSSARAFDFEPDFSLHAPIPYNGYEKDRLLTKSNMVLVNIFSSKESKNIPYPTAVSIIKHLKEKAIEPVVISSPSNEGINKRLSEEAGAEMLVTHSILDACRYIHLAKALISADTSLVHLAGTYNTPVLVISRAIEEELKKFAPKSDINIVVQSESKQTIVVSEEQVKKSIDKLIETIR